MVIHHIEPGDDRSSRQAVYEAFADRSQSVEAAIQRALAVGTQRLDVEVGFVTDISDGVQTVTAVQSIAEDDVLEAGDTRSLDEAYCRRTLELDSPLCVQDAGHAAEVSDRAYRSFGLDTYIGTAITVDGDRDGTICFADRETRSEPFPESDQLFVELVGRLVGQALERRRYEQALEGRNERLREQTERAERIADTTFDLLFEIDPDGNLTYVSTGAQTILGYEPETVTGSQFADVLAPSALPDAVDAFERVANGEAVRNLELAAMTADGDQAILEINATPVFEDGAVVAHQGVARDITARHDREAELRVKTRAIDSANIGIAIADATADDNPIHYVNEAFETLTGYPCGAILGRNCRLLQGPETDPDSVATLRDAIDAAEPVSVELVNYRQDGTSFWNKVRVVPVENEGSPSHFVGFQEDVTDQRRTSRLIGLLNRVLRHNLRNELNIIQGYAALVGDDSDTSGSTREAVGVIEDTVGDLVSLSDSVRELERIARQDRDPTRVDVADLFAEVASAVDETHPGATVDCRVELTDGVDVCAGVELGRALEELVENAVRHDPDGQTTVTVTAREVGDSVELVVADDGPGIPPVEAAVIEDGYETAVDHGDGLGLWLVNWIVTRYGGSFQIRPASADDDASGTVASISLPGLPPDVDVESTVRPHTTLFQ